MLSDTELSPELKLWRAVIKRAILDCCGIFEDSKFNNRLATRHRIIYEAESWFNNQTYKLVDFNWKPYKEPNPNQERLI